MAAQDKSGHAALKQAVKEKKAELEAKEADDSNVIDAEVAA